MAEPRRGRGPRVLSSTLPRIAGRAFRRRGFSETRVVTDWPEIVGAELARGVTPERLSFPRGQQAGGTLHLRASGPLALELRHLEPLVIERINRYFGYGAVARLAIVQGPVSVPRRRRPPARRELDADESKALEKRLESIEDADLRRSLDRLGRSVLGRQKVP